MKKYTKPEVKILALLQIEKNCLDLTQSGGDNDDELWDDFLNGEF